MGALSECGHYERAAAETIIVTHKMLLLRKAKSDTCYLHGEGVQIAAFSLSLGDT